MNSNKRPMWIWITAAIAVFFGIVTIKSGGSVLFIDGEARKAAGNYVDFVLWFNFTAGFFYVVSGVGIWFQKIWALKLSIILAVLTVLVFAALGIHIINGGEYEQRTIAAMTLRSIIWIAITIKSFHVIYHEKMNRKTKPIT